MMPRSIVVAAVVVLAAVMGEGPAAAQAWAPRPGQGSVTFVTQMIDHVGRVSGDQRRECCWTTNVAVAADLDYGLTDRWSVSASVPYVFSKYRGGPPGFPWLPYNAVDACHCLNSALQDVQLGAHYNVVRVPREWSVMTSMSVGVPTHNYTYIGEAVPGFGLTQLSLGVDADAQLRFVSPRLSVGGAYEYSVVERALDISHNRSNARLHAGYTFPIRLGAHVILSAQRTHGGLRMPDDVQPFPERYTEYHRLLRDSYLHAGAGVSYPIRDWELSLSMLRTVMGTYTHDVHVYSVTAGRSFRW